MTDSGDRFPPVQSNLVFLRGDAVDPLPAILERFSRCGCRVSRDVRIGSPGGESPLAADKEDFWFHTDGTFLKIPPRWIVIQVLETEGGGALEVLDCSVLALPAEKVWFGREDAGVEAAIVERVSGRAVTRYRKDYMRPLPGGRDLEDIHAIIREHAERNGQRIGELAPLDCLVVDNWSVLHRRLPFEGRRVIRRLWLDDPVEVSAAGRQM